MLLFILLLLSLFLTPISSIRSYPNKDISFLEYNEAPDYINEPQCFSDESFSVCNPSLIHVSMTLDSKYLRGSIAAVHSVLKHAHCPGNIYFHFIASQKSTHLTQIIKSIFPSLPFKVYPFDETRVNKLISYSIREALDNPLNYARIYLADIINPCVTRVIYLDSDIIVVDDVQKLWSVSLSGSRVVGAPVYCKANFTSYFTDNFWFDPDFSRVFQGKTPCYFNTGVMVIDLVKFRQGDYVRKIEKWMEIHKEKRIYELGSLPPFLLVFGGDVEGIDHRWNQHGLGGHNLVDSCRSLHPGRVSLLHWSGKGKPWVRLDAGMPCPVDYLWAPYDLHRSQKNKYFGSL